MRGRKNYKHPDINRFNRFISINKFRLLHLIQKTEYLSILSLVSTKAVEPYTDIGNEEPRYDFNS